MYTNFYTPNNEAFYASSLYKPLNATKRECRLLRFKLPFNPQEPLSCHILDQVPLTGVYGLFSAISYYAGDPRSTAEIIVNGFAFNAFKNLDSAIRDLASNWERDYPGRELILWTDQICIDQSNAPERSHQVGFMREIYQQAEHVFVHLSVPGDDLAYLAALRQVHVLKDVGSEVSHASFSGEADMVEPLEPANEKRFLMNMQIWTSVADVFNHTWWSRAWVYQEFIVANRAHFVLGPRACIPWIELSSLLSVALAVSRHQHLQSCKNYKQVLTNRKNKLEKEAIFLLEKISELIPKESELRKKRWFDLVLSTFTRRSELVALWACPLLWPILAGPCIIAGIKDRHRKHQLQSLESRINFLKHRYQQLDPTGSFSCRHTEYPREDNMTIWASRNKEYTFKHPVTSSIDEQQQHLDKLREHMAQISKLYKTRPLVEFVWTSKSTWNGPVPLSTLLRHASNVNTSEPRDKVYAFLGLTEPTYNLIPSYTPENTVTKVLTATAEAVIVHEKSVAIVWDALGTRSPETGFYLPSWVPDWTVPLRPENEMIASRMGWKAGGRLKPVTQFEKAGGSTVLVTLGICIDTLSEIVLDEDGLRRNFRGKTGLLFGTKSSVQVGDEAWILRGFDYPVILRKVDPCYSLRAETVVWEEQLEGDQSSLVESQILYGSLVTGDERWENVMIL
jgi:hypothetical protein